MVNVCICDDDIRVVNKIVNLLNENFIDDKINIYTFNNGKKLISFLMIDIIDILIIDIELGEMNGIDIAKNLKKNKGNMYVMFITSYIKYVSEVFRMDTFQFLLKPINEEDFIIDFKRALFKIDRNNETIRICNKDIIISNIYYIEINGRKINIYLKDSKIELIGRFKDYVDVLKEYDFFKVYRSILINMSKIEFYSGLSIKLKDFDELIPISRNIKNEFVQDYKKYKANLYI